jgi:hypothetical protein
MSANCIRRSVLFTAFCLLAFTASASAECAWVLWERAEHRVSTGLVGEWKPKDAYEAKRNCDSALTKTTKFLVSYGAENKYKVVIIAGRVSHFEEDGQLVAVYTVKCLPDTVDPRGPKGK